MASLDGPRYREPDATPIILGFITFLFIGALVIIISSANKTHKEFVEKQKQSYRECVERTQDVEWCFIKFDPELE